MLAETCRRLRKTCACESSLAASRRRLAAALILALAGSALATPPWLLPAQRQGVAAAAEAGDPSAKPGVQRPKNRAASVAALAARVGIGPGSAVADIGAGKGVDTWVFAGIVGESGTVYAQEIGEKMVEGLRAEAAARKLPQVRAVLGRNDDPALPHQSVDLAYMRYVYHHFSQPREMLRGIWKSLKPGGHLVVVDRLRGTLRDWAPRAERKDKHFWLAETTVVREAREEGFLFVGCAEDCCESADPFVLVFQRPKDPDFPGPGRDPDPFQPLPVRDAAPGLVPLGGRYERPVFVALGEARELMRPVLERSAGQAVEIVLEEWATQKDERPPLPVGVSLPSVLTENGDPRLGPEPVGAVFFFDAYHMLFHGKTLLAKLHERLGPAGLVYVLDREAAGTLPRREASHRRKIAPETVKEEMAAAGFFLWCEGPRPAPDRFLLVFGKARPEEVRPEDDPLTGGPAIDGTPGEWLRRNAWRLRGLRTAEGRCVPLPRLGAAEGAEKTASPGSDLEHWRLPAAKLVATFKKTDQGYVLADCRPEEAKP